MNSNKKRNLINHSIILALIFLFSFPINSEIKDNIFLTFGILTIICYLTVFIIAGIPSLIKKITKKQTNFNDSLIFGCYLSLFFLIFIILSYDYKIFSFNISTLQLILFIKLIIAVILIIIHAIFEKSVGFFYVNIFKSIIEKIFRVKIIEKKQIKVKQKKKKKLSQFSRFDKSIKNFWKILLTIAKNLNKIKKPLIVSGLSLSGVIILIIAVLILISSYKNIFLAKIIDFSPNGYTNQKMVIKVIYNSDISFLNPDNPGEVIKIEPALKGVAKIEGRTLLFIPDNDLPLSAKYKAAINTSLLTAKNKKFIEGKKFSFNTELMQINNASFYFNVDETAQKPYELIGEIEFSLPIDFTSLKERIEVKLDNKNLTISEPEKSERPNVFYLKIKGFEEKDTPRNINIVLKHGISPAEGILPLEDDYNTTVVLKEKPRLEVESCEAYPVSGNTYIAIKFNIPVNIKDVENNIQIEPKVAFKINSEYRYIVLNADFQPNTSYQIKINKHTKGLYGLEMNGNYTHAVQIKDMEPYVKFSSNGKILPMTDNLNIEFVSLNLDEVNLSVEKIYKNNLVAYLSAPSEEYNDDYNTNKKAVNTKVIKISEGKINEEIKNLINLKDLFNSKYQGIYRIKLSDTKQHYNYASMTVNITNIGLIIKNDGKDLNVFAINVLNLTPIPFVKISLISKESQILQETATNENGYALIKNYRLTRENLTPFLIFAELGEDFTCLELTKNELDYSTFDVSGKKFNAGLHEAFATTERGVYRPGENIYTTVVLRKSNLENPESIPLILKVSDPTSKVVYEKTFKTDNSGMSSLIIPTQNSFKTGNYFLNIFQDNTNIIGTANFKVEEFIPQKIEVKINILEKKYDSVKFKIQSNELHGAPSRGLKVKCWVTFKSEQFSSDKYSDYNFYNENNSDFNLVNKDFGESVLDANGEKSYEAVIDNSIYPPSSIRAIIYAEVKDDSGRIVSDAINLQMHKYKTYFGIKTEGKKPFKPNNEVKIKYVALNPDGKEITEKEARIKVERKVWYSIFKQFSWAQKYSSEYYNETILSKQISINKTGEMSFVPDKGGIYTISISKANGMTSTSTISVYDENNYEYRNLEEPYKLILTLDKKYYISGETAYLTIVAPFKGNSLLTIERDKIYKTQFVDLSTGKAVIPINITENFVPNMYINVMAFRTPTYELITIPPVSYGAINIIMDKSKLEQKIEMQTNANVRSKDGVKVDLFIPNGAGSKVVIAAVDEGILQITNYQRPEPYDFFYRKRELSIRTNTTLKDLLPDIAPYKKAFGGDGIYNESAERRHLNPIEAQRIKNVSLYSGILNVDNEGHVSHYFKLDQFNGKLRVMAFSVKDKKFGSAEAYVTVSDPIVLSAGIPRFLSPFDKTYISVKIFNKTNYKGKFKISMNVNEFLKIEDKKFFELILDKDEQKEIKFLVTAQNNAGVANITLSAEGNNENTFLTTELPVRPATQLKTNVYQGNISSNNEIKILNNMDVIPQGKFQALIISPNKLTRCIGALEYLVNYPYGCTEQTVSTAFPLLYLKNLANNVSVFGANNYLIDKYINIAIKKVESRILDDGNFSFWDGSNYVNPWISDYAAHFIIEAKNTGYPVSDKVYKLIVDRIGVAEYTNEGKLDRRKYNQPRDISSGSYRLFLKSLLSKPDFDSLQYFYEILKDNKKSKETSEKDRCMIALAYALAGDKSKAKELLPDNFLIKTFIRSNSFSFDSYVRNTALYLYALSIIDPNNKKINYLEEELFKNISSKGNFGNTQDTSWALMAMAKSQEAKKEIPINIEIYADNILWKKINKETAIKKEELTGKEYKIKNLGKNTCYYNFTSFGYPLVSDNKKKFSGFEVSKAYLDKDGKSIDIKNIKRGEQVVVSLSVKNKANTDLENLVLVDLLPAGLEIENLRIASRGNYPNLPLNNVQIDYQDIRDDRILIFAKNIKDKIQFSYTTRAVSSGEFINPQFQTEAMYDPKIYGMTGGDEKIVIND